MNVEEAYKVIATMLIAKAGEINWTTAVGDFSVYDRMVKSGIRFYLGDSMIAGNGKVDLALKAEAADAVLFLRDDLLDKTSERIWKVTFKLYESGKFNIEYGYDKPEIIDGQ